MKKFIGSIKNRKGTDQTRNADNNGSFVSGPMVPPQGANPEAVVAREVIAFCESGAPGSQTAGEEYLHLPAIVDGAESSPTAAREASLCIKRYLGREHYDRGFAQYNAIMLSRILTDNPGRNFTQNFDKDFVSTVKRLLRDSRDSSVQQILRETLDHFEAEKAASNETLGPLLEMWRKEKGSGARLYQNATPGRYGPPAPANRPRTLPPPDELAARIEEAKTTARLLLQTLQSTPASEISSNDLIIEFAGRVKSAQSSIQRYMSCENPRPDDDTMLTLIETSEQLNIALSRHQRALLQARKTTASPLPQSPPVQPMMGGQDVYSQPLRNSTVQPTQPMVGGQNAYGQPPQIPGMGLPATNGSGFSQSTFSQDDHFMPPPGPPPGARGAFRPPQTGNIPSNSQATENPFTDDAGYDQPQNSYSLFGKTNNNTATGQQPYSGYTPPSPPPQPDQRSSYPSQLRPGAGYAATPSYIHRQESATHNITMHGASPPQEPTR